MARFQNVPVGSYSVRFEGIIHKGGLIFEDFDFTVSIAVTKSTPFTDPNTFTVWIESQEARNENPPVPESKPNPYLAYLPWIFIGFGVFGFAVLFWGWGPEMFEMAMRRK